MHNLLYKFKLYLIILLTFFIFTSFVKAEIINKIDVEGNQRISSETIVMFSGVSLKEDLSENDLNIVLKQLYDSNFFELVNVKVENNILFIKVKENPIIQDVIYNGVKSSEILKKIKEDIILKPRSSFNDVRLIKDKETITTKLKSLGYYFAEIETSIEEMSDNKVNLIYDISLGKKSKIKKISFIGNI